MTWETFYLICFVVGLALSLLSFLAVSFHLPVKWHLPHAHVGHTPHGAGVHPAGGPDGAYQASPYNFATLMAFIAWFGGTGYLMSHYYGSWFLLVFSVALLSGIAGASVVFWFLAKVLLSREQSLDPADYELVGMLGKVSSSIREGGTGEIIFAQEGARRVSGARSESGAAIAKGEEVVITRYERGIAYVRRWKDLMNEEATEEARESDQRN
ncbi:MAG TPA: hypothetical protein VGL91_17765 [Acidobacteriota bacterium]